MLSRYAADSDRRRNTAGKRITFDLVSILFGRLVIRARYHNHAVTRTVSLLDHPIRPKWTDGFDNAFLSGFLIFSRKRVSIKPLNYLFFLCSNYRNVFFLSIGCASSFLLCRRIKVSNPSGCRTAARILFVTCPVLIVYFFSRP